MFSFQNKFRSTVAAAVLVGLLPAQAIAKGHGGGGNHGGGNHGGSRGGMSQRMSSGFSSSKSMGRVMSNKIGSTKVVPFKNGNTGITGIGQPKGSRQGQPKFDPSKLGQKQTQPKFDPSKFGYQGQKHQNQGSSKKSSVLDKFNGKVGQFVGKPFPHGQGHHGQGGGMGNGGGKGQGNGMGGKWSHKCHWPSNFCFSGYLPYYWPTPGSYACSPTVIYETAPVVVQVVEVPPAYPTTPSPATGVQPASATTPAVETTTPNVDLVLESIELADPTESTSGPVYRVRFRNVGTTPAGRFRVGLVAGYENRSIEESPRAVADVPGLGPSQVGEVQLRLPLGSMLLVGTSTGSSNEFSFLAAAVDVDEAVKETDKTNNVASVARGELFGEAEAVN